MLRFQQYLVVATLVAAQPAAGQSLSDRLDTYLQPYADADYLSGTVLVARGDSVLYERSFGWANRELRVPFTPATRSNIASITKPMTVAILVGMAVEGLIRPDQTLSTWIPAFPRAEEITVSHLLNHRAGIPHRVTTPEQETVPRTAADMVELAMAAEQLPHDPGAVSVYSSATYSVLARVLELAGGADYATLLERYLTAPAGMTDTWHGSQREILPGRAASYGWGPAGVAHPPLQDLSFLVGAGSVYSTARDLYRMQRALIGGTLGETAQQALVRASGLSWNGSTSGFRAWADWHRETDVTVILTANLQSGANDLIREDIPRIVAGEAVPARPIPDFTPVAVPAERLAWLTGSYAQDGGSPVDLRVADGGFWIGTWWLYATSDTTFFSPGDFAVITATRGADGVPVLDWDSPVFDSVWRRVAP